MKKVKAIWSQSRKVVTRSWYKWYFSSRIYNVTLYEMLARLVGIVAASIAVGIFIETTTSIWDAGLPLWTGSLVAFEAFVGVALLGKSFREGFLASIRANYYSSMFLSLIFIVLVLVVSYVLLPLVGREALKRGHQRFVEHNYSDALYWYEIAIQVDTDGFTEFLRIPFSEPNSGSEEITATIAMFEIAQIYSTIARYDDATHIYQEILLRDECFLPAYFYLSSIYVAQGNFLEAHSTVDSGLEQILPMDNTAPTCQRDESEMEWTRYELYLMRGRAYTVQAMDLARRGVDAQGVAYAATRSLERAERIMPSVTTLDRVTENQKVLPLYYWKYRACSVYQSEYYCDDVSTLEDLCQVIRLARQSTNNSPSIGWSNTLGYYEADLETILREHRC